MRGRRQAQPFAAGGDKLSPQVQHHAVTFALRTRGTATSSVPNACTACSTRQCHVSCFISHASCHGDPKLQTLCCMAWLSPVRLCKRADGCAHSLRLVSAHASVPKSRMNAWQQSNLRGGDRRNPPPRDLGCMMLGAHRGPKHRTNLTQLDYACWPGGDKLSRCGMALTRTRSRAPLFRKCRMATSPLLHPAAMLSLRQGTELRSCSIKQVGGRRLCGRVHAAPVLRTMLHPFRFCWRMYCVLYEGNGRICNRYVCRRAALPRTLAQAVAKQHAQRQATKT